MSTLVIVEHDNQHLHKNTYRMLCASLLLCDSPVLLIVGYNCQAVAQQAATLAGVKSVYVVDNPCYEHQLAENVSQVVAFFAKDFRYIMAASSTYGKDLLPRVAGILELTQVSDVTTIIDQDTFEHPIYAGHAIETVRVLDDKLCLTIRVTAFEEHKDQQPPCPINSVDTIVSLQNKTFIEIKRADTKRPELTKANIIVSGGRGLQSADNFNLIKELADLLGAGIGASRAAVDAGFISNNHQIGQTGKIVAPNIYIAIGISGAVQHLAGIKDSKIIIAINKDKDAPIFSVANYGLIGNLFEMVPQLIEKIRVYSGEPYAV